MPKKKGSFEWTPKRLRFVDEYLIDCNATDAAKRAGFSAKAAKAIGYELMRMPQIKAAIEERQRRRAEETGVTQKWVLDNLKTIVERCMVGGQEFQPAGANKALELLGKHLGMFVDRLAGPDGGPIQYQRIERVVVDPAHRDR